MVAAWFVAPRTTGKGGVEVVGPLERTVEVATARGGTRSVTLWMRVEVRDSAVFEVYREEASATVRLGGDVAGLDAASVNREIERMVREEEVTRPALGAVATPRIERDGSEADSDVVRWRWVGVGLNLAALAATGLGFGMLGFGLVSIVASAQKR